MYRNWVTLSKLSHGNFRTECGFPSPVMASKLSPHPNEEISFSREPGRKAVGPHVKLRGGSELEKKAYFRETCLLSLVCIVK